MATSNPPARTSSNPASVASEERNELSSSDATHEGRRIYILGTGSIGKFVAHSLHNRPSPPAITLLFHKPSYLHDFKKVENGSMLNITTHGHPSLAGPFTSELVVPERVPNFQGTMPRDQLVDRRRIERRYTDAISDAPIGHLVITTKAHQTVKSLLPLKHRLTKDSTLLFLQNGCGTVDEVNRYVFPDPHERPHYLAGINSHGVHATGPASAVHAGHGVIYIGLVSEDSMRRSSRPSGKSGRDSNVEASLPATARYLLRSFTHLPILAALPVPSSTLTLHQLDKLAVNCVVNPLTVLLDAQNGAILHNQYLSRTMRLLLFEISAIFRRLPEVQDIPNIDVRFSPDRLEDLVLGVARKTGENISSMLQDVRRGVETEIDYLNGWVVRRGESVGVKAVVNYSMVTLVKGKQGMISREMDGYMPFEGGRNRL